MFSTPILDVAIGLALLYLILALACTAINETIALLLSLRAETLWEAVRGLFQNSPVGEQFARQLYDHDLIDALSPATTTAKPSYIPAHLFSLALVDRLGFHEPAGDTPKPPSVLGQLNAAEVDESIKKVLRPLAASAGNDLDRFRLNLEAWFEAAMQRASGWYKKRVQMIILAVAFLLALVLNADSLLIANSLWSNPAQRAQVSTAAQNLVAKPPTAAGANVAGAVAQLPLDRTALAQAQGQVGSLLGWSGPFLWTARGYDAASPRRFPDGLEWISKLVGLLVTAFAASLGAPFWFDMLNKIINIRSAGTAPEERPRRSGELPRSQTRIVSQPSASPSVAVIEPSDRSATEKKVQS